MRADTKKGGGKPAVQSQVQHGNNAVDSTQMSLLSLQQSHHATTTTHFSTSKPKLLDLFSGAGGAAKGYYDAGFDVTGVDIVFQKNYPYRFIQADAMTFPLDGFDVIHASPPCQGFSMASHFHGVQRNYSNLIPDTRQRLEKAGKPYIIENVSGAPLIKAIM